MVVQDRLGPTRLFAHITGPNPELAALAPFLQATHRGEAELYHHLASPLRAAGRLRLVVFEDLAARDCKLDQPERPRSVDKGRTGVEDLATLDARLAAQHHPRAPENRPLRRHHAQDKAEPEGTRFQQEHAALLLERERRRKSFEALWSFADENDQNSSSSGAFQCIAHDDPPHRQHFRDADWRSRAPSTGRPWPAAAGFTTWRNYFVASALAIENRRAHEERVRCNAEAVPA
ncbi:hypothetical protein PG994_002570 [Apiospora phragmitis]|uniref:Uncharacterized protein n=1 Tax=Apiospora phragmitis TaxID=2905665 RepID=A0ABR1W5H4_9PEZI